MGGNSKPSESSWQNYYSHEIEKAGGIERFFNQKICEKKQLIESIIANTPEGGRIVEAGCGTAVDILIF